MLSKKYLIGAMILLFLVVGLFSGVRMAKAQNVIKIGIFGPQTAGIEHWSAGMWTAAQMLVDMWYPGGWNIGGTTYTIQVVPANEYTETPSNIEGIQNEIKRLVETEHVNFIVGGFRTECVNIALTYWHEHYSNVPFFINGAATNELIGNTVGADHDSWKNLYRIMPTNSSALVGTFVTAVKTVLCSPDGFLLKLFGKVTWPGNATKQVKTAVFVESLEWANIMWNLLTNPYVYPGYLGWYVNVSQTASRRLPDGVTIPANYQDFKDAVAAADSEGCNLALIVFSGIAGKWVQKAVNELQAKMLVLGIDVSAQSKSAWAGGEVEYESHLMAMGTRTPLTPQLVQFWDDFLAWSQAHGLGPDNWPVYTAVGVGNAFITLKNATETTGSLDPDVLHNYLCPRTNPTRVLQVLNGMAKFTEQHDIYQHPLGYDYSNYWTGNARSWVVQWLDALLVPVYPAKYMQPPTFPDIPFAKIWCLPPWMYTLIWDITYDGYVGVDDVVIAAENFGAEPGQARWDHRSDVTFDDYVGVDDIVVIAEHFASEWTGP